MMRFKQVVVVATPLPKIEVGYFSLKNARNSSLKRVTNTSKIAIDISNISILDSLHNVPPLSLKNSKKKPVLKRTGYFTQGLNLFRLPLSGRVIISKKDKNIINLLENEDVELTNTEREMMELKGAVVVATPLPKIEVGYFSLKNARNSSLKRVTNTSKIAIDISNISILDSLHNVPPLSLKNSKKKPASLGDGLHCARPQPFFHRLLLSARVNYIKIMQKTNKKCSK